MQYADREDGHNYTKTKARRYRAAVEGLQRAVAHWLQKEEAADDYFVLQLGDLLDGFAAATALGSEGTLERLLAELGKLGCPVYHCIGTCVCCCCLCCGSTQVGRGRYETPPPPRAHGPSTRQTHTRQPRALQQRRSQLLAARPPPQQPHGLQGLFSAPRLLFRRPRHVRHLCPGLLARERGAGAGRGGTEPKSQRGQELAAEFARAGPALCAVRRRRGPLAAGVAGRGAGGGASVCMFDSPEAWPGLLWIIEHYVSYNKH